MVLEDIAQGKVMTGLYDQEHYIPIDDIWLNKKGYSGYYIISDLSDDHFFVDTNNKVVFGGRHYNSFHFQDFGNTPYLFAEHSPNGQKGWYDEEGNFYPNVVGPMLVLYKHDIAELGLWDSFYESCNKIFYAIDSIDDKVDKNRFLEQVISDLKERIAKHKDNSTLKKKDVQQFVQGLEYLADHPDEAVGFIGGGQRQ